MKEDRGGLFLVGLVNPPVLITRKSTIRRINIVRKLAVADLTYMRVNGSSISTEVPSVLVLAVVTFCTTAQTSTNSPAASSLRW